MASPHREFPVPFRNAPYHTHHIVGVDDFKTTNLSSFVRHQPHSINKAVYNASKERRSNQAITCKLDPPYRLWLTEKELRRKDYIKFKFEKRGLTGRRPNSHLVTKKELQAHHLRREVDDYHLSQDVELCDVAVHPDHKLSLVPHAVQYHDPELQKLEVHTKSLAHLKGPFSKTPPDGKSPGHSKSLSKLPPVGSKSPAVEPKKSLW
jgi:hypothetical protein